MENNEILEVNQTPENVEQTTEQTTPKMFTQEEVNEIVGKAKATARAKAERSVRKEYDRDYGELMETLEAGTGKKGVKEVKDTLRNFYTSKGVKMPEKPTYSQKDIERLVKAEAEEFISAGYEDVVDEVDRLADIGLEKMTDREKALFHTLATHRQNTERSMELSKLGVTEDVYTSKEFQDFAKKFSSDTSMSEVYEIYKLKHPSEKPKTMGSMKNTSSGDAGVKEFYTPEEARRFTKKDYDKNPALFAAVEKSMLKWRK